MQAQLAQINYCILYEVQPEIINQPDLLETKITKALQDAGIPDVKHSIGPSTQFAYHAAIPEGNVDVYAFPDHQTLALTMVNKKPEQARTICQKFYESIPHKTRTEGKTCIIEQKPYEQKTIS